MHTFIHALTSCASHRWEEKEKLYLSPKLMNYILTGYKIHWLEIIGNLINKTRFAIFQYHTFLRRHVILPAVTEIPDGVVVEFQNLYELLTHKNTRKTFKK
jgi:hypothetical protein